MIEAKDANQNKYLERCKINNDYDGKEEIFILNLGVQFLDGTSQNKNHLETGQQIRNYENNIRRCSHKEWDNREQYIYNYKRTIGAFNSK